MGGADKAALVHSCVELSRRLFAAADAKDTKAHILEALEKFVRDLLHLRQQQACPSLASTANQALWRTVLMLNTDEEEFNWLAGNECDNVDTEDAEVTVGMEEADKQQLPNIVGFW